MYVDGYRLFKISNLLRYFRNQLIKLVYIDVPRRALALAEHQPAATGKGWEGAGWEGAESCTTGLVGCY